MYEGILSNKNLVRELHRAAFVRKFNPVRRWFKFFTRIATITLVIAGGFTFAAVASGQIIIY